VDALDLARIQFALTISFHFVFPTITIGLSGIVAIVETLRWWTRNDVYDRLAVFLTRLFAVTFVTGVVSGIVMEFQFGTNWSAFSGFVGDIFGAPLAAEAIFAFFIESTFLGLLIFGRSRLSSTARWLSACMVAFGTLFSAFWILVAGSWMHTPAGYECYPDPAICSTATKVVLVDFAAAVFNPSFIPRFLHTVAACYVAGAFFVLGISAYYLLRGRHLDVAGVSLRLALVLAFLGSGAMFATGDMQIREVAEYQPLKFAAMEGLFETQRGADLTIYGLPPSQHGPNDLKIAIPDGLSVLMSLDPNAEVKGLDQQPDRSLWPPVSAVFFGFHTMVGIGSLMLLLMTLGVFFWWRRSLEKRRWWLWLAVLAIPLPVAAVELGWMVTEMGRQPWIIQGLLMTSQGVSPGVPASDVAISLAGIVALYALLFGLWLYTLRKEIVRGPAEAPGAQATEGGN
jgi:cytochrome d ubiquinol oxidase subunit I